MFDPRYRGQKFLDLRHPRYPRQNLLDLRYHATRAKIWPTPTTNPRTQATHATHVTYEPTLPMLFSKLFN